MHFFKQNHKILSNIMDLLEEEKATDPSLYQEVTFIEFCMTSVMLVQITTIINTRF